jgi:uncharacterized protein with HEPN domain
MPPDARTYLWDARRAGERIATFVADKTWDDYQSDVLVRSAVERQFEILGEALNKLSRAEAGFADRIEDLPRIVAFRNVLIHGYATVDDRIVWEVATKRLPRLLGLLSDLLDEGTT